MAISRGGTLNQYNDEYYSEKINFIICVGRGGTHNKDPLPFFLRKGPRGYPSASLNRVIRVGYLNPLFMSDIIRNDNPELSSRLCCVIFLSTLLSSIRHILIKEECKAILLRCIARNSGTRKFVQIYLHTGIINVI